MAKEQAFLCNPASVSVLIQQSVVSGGRWDERRVDPARRELLRRAGALAAGVTNGHSFPLPATVLSSTFPLPSLYLPSAFPWSFPGRSTAFPLPFRWPFHCLFHCFSTDLPLTSHCPSLTSPLTFLTDPLPPPGDRASQLLVLLAGGAADAARGQRLLAVRCGQPSLKPRPKEMMAIAKAPTHSCRSGSKAQPKR